jgi:hypothetical protein
MTIFSFLNELVFSLSKHTYSNGVIPDMHLTHCSYQIEVRICILK